MAKIAMTFVLVMSLMVSTAFAVENNLDRGEEPIVLTGEKLPALVGTMPENLSVFAKVGGVITPIPFQIDQKDESGNYAFTDGEKKSADPNPKFDSNDELVFLASDMGGKAAKKELPVCGGEIVEVALSDSNGNSGWIYVLDFGGSGIRSSVDYVRYDVATDTVTTDEYSIGYAKDAPACIGFLAGSDGKNTVDRFKMRFETKLYGVPKVLVKDENAVTSKTVAWIDGPVRVIRLAMVKQVLFWKVPTPPKPVLHVYYKGRFEYPIRVDMPFSVDQYLKNPKYWVAMDSLCSSGAKVFFSERNPKPAALDGKVGEEETYIGTAVNNWMVVKGAGASDPGWISHVDKVKGPSEVEAGLFYLDNAEPNSPETEPGSCGEFGVLLKNLNKIEKKTMIYRWIFQRFDTYDPSLPQQFVQEFDSPLSVSATVVE